MKKAMFLFVFAVFTAVGFGQTTVFYYTSSPQSWVGQGKTETLTPAGGYTFSGGGSQGYTTINIDNLTAAGGDWFYLTFHLPAAPFQIGKVYDATKIGVWAEGPQMSFSANGHASNGLTGWFQVFDFVTGADGKIKSLAIDFYQLDEGRPTWWNFGSIRIDTTVPLTLEFGGSAIPEPGTYAAIAGACVLGFALYRKRRKPIP